MKYKKLFKRTGWILLFIFILMNVVAYFHAYKFTHFANTTNPKTKAETLSFGKKIITLFTGIDNPRPQNSIKPNKPFESIILNSNKKIACWLLKADSSRGTVILFHGYGGEKSSLLDKADIFLQLGYNTLLVDFMGSGESEGNQTTIGYKEAEEVRTCFNYLADKGEKNIYLFGTSLGAAAIIKSIYSYKIKPSGILIECPFGSLYKTTCARFNTLGVPSFPMAGLLVFWGGVQNGFWGFGYRPSEYAAEINSPTLLLYGEKDEKVSREEIDEIYKNLRGQKTLVSFPNAAHENYLIKYKTEWRNAVSGFLNADNKISNPESPSK